MLLPLCSCEHEAVDGSGTCKPERPGDLQHGVPDREHIVDDEDPLADDGGSVGNGER